MFGFLTPIALFGLALLSVPILLHIFKPRKVRQTPFSSLRWLRASQHRMSRRIKWHQVLLLMLRASLVVLLVLALAKPIISFGDAAGTRSMRFVVLDVSRSMGYQPRRGDRPIDAGKRVAEQLVRQVNAGDRTTVILAGRRPQLLGPLVGDANAYLTPMQAAKAESSDSDLGGALRMIQPLITTEGDADTHVDLYVVTDNHVRNWSQADITRFVSRTDAPVRVHVVDVGAELVENAWIADARLIESTQPARREVRVRAGAVGDEPVERTIRLSGLDGIAEQKAKVLIEPGRFAGVAFELPVDYDLAGQVAHIALAPGDALAGDDVHYLNLDKAGATRVLLIAPSPTAVPELRPDYHLVKALEALGDANPGTLAVTRVDPHEILTDPIAASDVIILAEVPRLPDSTRQAIEQRVAAGGSAIIFVGPSIDQAHYNTKMHDPLRPTTCLLPTPLGDRSATDARIAQVRWRHPIFAALSDPVYSDLGQVRFEQYFRMPYSEAVTDTVLATIGDAAPAIIERGLGEGHVLVMNMTPNDAWTDLPRRPSYIVMLDRMVSYLTGGTARNTFSLGEVVRITLPENATDAPVTVRPPTGAVMTVASTPSATRRVVQIEGLAEPGVYEVRYASTAGDARFPVVVQAGGGESVMVPADAQTLGAWWEPASFNVIRPDARTGRVELKVERMLLEPWLIVAACAVLLAEMFFVHWLCPKMNPAVMSASVVSRQGFIKGGTTGGEADA